MPYVLFDEESGKFYGYAGSLERAKVYSTLSGVTKTCKYLNRLNMYWFTRGVTNSKSNYIIIEINVSIKKKSDLNKVRISRL